MTGFTFAGAETAKKAAPKKDAMPDRDVAGINDLAALDTVLGSIKSIRNDIETEIKTANAATFVELGCATHAKPKSFRGVESGSVASCELRKRSSDRALTAEEITLCDELDLGYKVVVDTIDTFIINPDVLQNAKIMSVLEKLIAGAVSKGQLPSNVMKKQDGVSRTVLNDDALTVLFAKATPEVAARALPLVATQALGKAQFNGSLDDALKTVNGLMGRKAFGPKKG